MGIRYYVSKKQWDDLFLNARFEKSRKENVLKISKRNYL